MDQHRTAESLATLAVAIGVVLCVGGTADAAVSCNYAAGTAAITADAAGNTAILGRNVSLPVEGINVAGSQCGAATVDNTDLITYTDSSCLEYEADRRPGIRAAGAGRNRRARLLR